MTNKTAIEALEDLVGDACRGGDIDDISANEKIITDALAREAALREELNQCGSMAAMIEQKEWAEHAGSGPVSSRVESAFTQLHNELSEAQQRLTVAEQRASELEGLLRKAQQFVEAWDDDSQEWMDLSSDISNAIPCDSIFSLKPAAEPDSPIIHNDPTPNYKLGPIIDAMRD